MTRAQSRLAQKIKMARNFEVDARVISNQICKIFSEASQPEDAMVLVTYLWNCIFSQRSCNDSSNFDGIFSFETETKDIFLKKHFLKLCESLIGLARHSWFPKIEDHEKKTFISFFLKGPAKDVFVALSNTLTQSNTGVLKETITLLTEYFKCQRFLLLLSEQCQVIPKISSVSKNMLVDPAVQLEWDQLIKVVVSLPERIANKLKLSNKSCFYPKQYFEMVAKDILKTLEKVHLRLSESKDCSIIFLSQLFSRICSLKHADDMYSVMLPSLVTWTKESPLWCRICTKLILSCPDHTLEAVLEPLLFNLEEPMFLSQMLGDSVLNNQKINFLFTHKFLLIRHYTQDVIPYCIIGYLSKSKGRRALLLKTLKKLMDVWGDKMSLNNISFDQHLYITKSILLSIGFLPKEEREEHKQELIMTLMEAVPAHLECPIEKIRTLGMIVAEEVTKAIDPKGHQLDFEFNRDEETKYLSSLAREPHEAIRGCLKQDTNSSAASSHLQVKETSKKPEEKPPTHTDLDLDSDDDLEPYVLDDEDDNTDSVNGVRPPAYLRDCISGLLSPDDPNRLEACLRVAEKLIRREPGQLNEVAVELVKVLLYLQDNYDTSHFFTFRHGAMVAATVKCPKLVAPYLTVEFYAENYNLRQRMDMLEVLTSAAQELSQPIEDNPRLLRKHLPLPMIPGIVLEEKPDWKLIVEERIKSKTRIFAKGPSKPGPKAVANRFDGVAGEFFFPLLKNFDSKLNTFDLLGQDCLVLGKLIYTLGTIMQAAAGLSITRQMASVLLDFIWELRYHREPFVRQALMYALSMTVLSCPSHILISELQSELMECHGWIQDVVNQDPDNECKKLAVQTLLLMESAFKKEITGE